MNPSQTTVDARDARIAELEALLAKKSKAPGASIKVSAKGAVSVYGLGRFPVTLYASQWEKLSAKMPEIQAFVLTNIATLAKKGE